MKNLFTLLIILFFSIQISAQSQGSENKNYNYQHSLERKEDFWSKVKSVFKSKKKNKSTSGASDPVLVKNDPNRTVKRVKNTYNKSYNETETVEMADETKKEKNASEVKEKPAKKKKTFAQVWNQLVNGKDYVPQKNYNHTFRKNNTNVTVKYTTTNSKPVVNRPYTTSKSLASNIKPTPKKEQASAKINLLNKAPIAAAKSNKNIINPKSLPANRVAEPAKSNQLVAVRSAEIKKNTAITNTEKSTAKEKQPVNASNNVKPKSTNVPVAKPAEVKKPVAVNIPVKPVEAKKEIVAPVDNTIRNEAQALSLTKSVNGNAAYFFSGITSGKFYAITNIASKGSVIKITNTQNGKSLFAEVMDYLPSSDNKKGLLLKLSDNAKMPLGQKNNSFTVKVNY